MVKHWITDVGLRNKIEEVNAEVIPYGSYALEVFSRTSDIDLLVIAPDVASMQYDFFQQLLMHIETIPAVNNVRTVERARVPLIKFSVDGIEVDVSFARLKTNFKVPTPEDLHKENFCMQSALDAQSRLTLDSVRSNWFISQAVGANREIFVYATSLLKCWATSRGIYGNLYCYLGGIHLTVMSAYAARKYNGVSLAGFIALFLNIFRKWNWINPVSLQGTNPAARDSMCLRVVKPGTNELCSSNVTVSTLVKIRNELLRGNNLTKDLSWEWSSLLEPYPYDIKYRRFVKVRVFVLDGEVEGWMSFVKSRIAYLIRSLEETKVKCDPITTEYEDLPPTGSQAKIRVFLWGIVDNTRERIQYDLTGVEDKWKHNLCINNAGVHGEIKLDVVGLNVFRQYNKKWL